MGFSEVKQNKNIKFVGKWMDLENTLLSKISQVQKDKSSLISLRSQETSHNLLK